MGSTARSPRVRARVTPHRGQGESLVPLYTRESVSLILSSCHVDMGYGLMTWEMTVSIPSSPTSIWDILSLWSPPAAAAGRFRVQGSGFRVQRLGFRI